jgi:uncharacterized membrane protein YsdA (DUF1294 family)
MVELLATAQPAASGSTLWTFVATPKGILICWLILINLVTFFVFGLDKLKAKRKETHEATRRVPEKTLFTLSIIGGSVGALIGMRAFHHKTLHRSFRIGIPVILLLQIIIPAGLYLYWNFIRGM